MAIKKYICLALLFVSNLMAAQTISRYEYWLGNDHSNKWTVRSSQESISLSIPTQNMRQGLQMLNFRVMNSDGDWSPIQRMLYYIPDATETEATVEKYEWWMDDNINSKLTSQTFSAGINGLNVGMHCLNLRVCNSNGDWSPILRMLFYIPDDAEKEATITDYEWWIDDNVQSRNTSKTISVVTNGLATGIHCLNIRIRNSNGDWSPIQRFLFFIPDEAEAQAEMAEIEYWIDEDYSKAVNEHSAMRAYNMSINISSYEVGVHTLNFRAKNSTGAWSTPSRFLFYIPDTSDEGNSPYNGYYYSFNDKLSFVSIPEQQEINMRNLVVAIPNLTEIGNVDSGCTFSINTQTNEACLSRIQPVNFAMWFTKKDGTKSDAATITFNMSDVLTKDIEPFSVGLNRTIAKPSKGDFHAFSFDVLYQQQMTFTASIPCKLRLFDCNGRMIIATSLLDGWQFTLPVGSYYAVISNSSFGNSSTSEELTYSLVPSIMLQDDGDDLQEYLNSLFDTEDVVAGTTYTRQFLNTDWQALCVPFSIKLSDWQDLFDVARINGFKVEDNGDVRYVLEGVIMTPSDGDIEPNRPYLIRAKQKRIHTFTCEYSSQSSQETVAGYEVGSIGFSISGNFASSISDMNTKQQYRMQGGWLSIPTSDDEVLPPYRWYLTIESKSRQLPADSRLEVRIVEKDETVDIDDMTNFHNSDAMTDGSSAYDLLGRRMGGGKLRKGLYIVNEGKHLVK